MIRCRVRSLPAPLSLANDSLGRYTLILPHPVRWLCPPPRRCSPCVLPEVGQAIVRARGTENPEPCRQHRQKTAPSSRPGPRPPPGSLRTPRSSSTISSTNASRPRKNGSLSPSSPGLALSHVSPAKLRLESFAVLSAPGVLKRPFGHPSPCFWVLHPFYPRDCSRAGINWSSHQVRFRAVVLCAALDADVNTA